ncbi:helix-turn-helix domain-containing protein [Flavobacterium psychrophilum]|uniref:terminase gpP N-terminus-related DNA-binding protein n=1 Tax=Flavobacterium psychrophilum TaxID=96345 RepID=UPI001C8F9016|nr:helix-turn-helix domain-containing protein [Flavobacterium psychrophilum]QZL00100.1 helix-turn-helix domain-containing protein [Flavobacterium psychrophilum]
MKTSKKKPVEPKQRNTYTLDDKASAKRYYLIGLTLQEISKLIDAPVRTIEKWQISENWKQLRETNKIHSKALDLYISGKTYKEIATLLNKSTATIWRYLTTAKLERKNETK